MQPQCRRIVHTHTHTLPSTRRHAVNGTASAVRGLGTLHGKVQSGRVQAYAIGIAAGTALLVLAFALGT